MSLNKVVVTTLLATGALLIATLLVALNKRPVKAGLRARIVENAGQGDCLFYCYQQALASLRRPMSIKALRRAVAGTMTQERFETLRTIYSTAKEDNDMDLLADYAWVGDSRDLQQLKDRMMKPTYFGDDMALAALEKLTGLNTTVVKDGVIQKRVEREQPTGLYIVLLLKDMHYRILSINQTLVFRGSVPAAVMKLALSQ